MAEDYVDILSMVLAKGGSGSGGGGGGDSDYSTVTLSVTTIGTSCRIIAPILDDTPSYEIIGCIYEADTNDSLELPCLLYKGRAFIEIEGNTAASVVAVSGDIQQYDYQGYILTGNATATVTIGGE